MASEMCVFPWRLFPKVCAQNIHIITVLCCFFFVICPYGRHSSKEGMEEVIRFDASLRRERNEGLRRVCANLCTCKLPMDALLRLQRWKRTYKTSLIIGVEMVKQKETCKFHGRLWARLKFDEPKTTEMPCIINVINQLEQKYAKVLSQFPLCRFRGSITSSRWTAEALVRL